MRHQHVEDRRRSEPTVNGEHSSTCLLTSAQDLAKHLNLILPVHPKLRRPIKPDFPNVLCLGEQLAKETDLTFSFMSKLRVQPQPRPDARCPFGKRMGPGPCRRRCRNGEDVQAALDALTSNGDRIRIEIEVAVKINHLTP